jgi:hypothetical protein
VLPEPELPLAPSLVVAPLLLSPDLLVPVEPVLPRGTACADRPSDDDPEAVGAGLERDVPPPPDPPPDEPDEVACPPSLDPPLRDPPPDPPPPRLCWAYAIGEKAKNNAADVKIASRLFRLSWKSRVIALFVKSKEQPGCQVG